MKTMDCTAAEKLIIVELDEGLEPSARALLDEHLQACPACRQAMDETMRLVKLVASDVPEEPGPEFWTYYETSLKARLRDTKSTPWWHWWWKPFAVAAVAVLAFVVVHVSTMDTVKPTVAPDAKVSAALAQVFEQVYGPVEEESSPYVLVGTDRRSLAALSTTYTDDDFVPWFEIEDESSHFL
jgi:predicted anti-sigma-YlaC factor YlaD